MLTDLVGGQEAPLGSLAAPCADANAVVLPGGETAMHLAAAAVRNPPTTAHPLLVAARVVDLCVSACFPSAALLLRLWCFR